MFIVSTGSYETAGPRIVGDPSILKTPVIARCTKPVDRMEAEARERHQSEARAYQAGVAVSKTAKAVEAIDTSPPRCDRYLVENATVEALAEVLRDDDGARFRAAARKVLVRQDEMSEFFANFDRYTSGGRGGGDRGAYLRLFNGGRFTVDRIARGSFAIPNWSACFLGGIQPGPIQRIAKDAADDGLLQRFLYVVPGHQEPGQDRLPDRAAGERYDALFTALAALRPPLRPDNRHPQAVVLHEGAHRFREQVDNVARTMAAMPVTSARMKSALGKFPGMFARLTLTFHMIDIADANARGERCDPTQVVTPATAERAARFMTEIALAHLIRADAVMFLTTQSGHAAWIAGYILAHRPDRITVRDVVRNYPALRAPERRMELDSVMASLVAVGWLEPDVPANPARQVSSWRVNPKVHERFGARAERERARRAAARADIIRKATAHAD